MGEPNQEFTNKVIKMILNKYKDHSSLTIVLYLCD